MISLTNIISFSLPFRYVDEEVGGIRTLVRGAGSYED